MAGSLKPLFLRLGSALRQLGPAIRQLGAKRATTLGVVIIVLLGAGFLMGRHTAERDPMAGAGQAGTMYQCPMHPTYISDSKGECPICGMSLVAVAPQASGHEGHGGREEDVKGYAPVTLAPPRQQLIGVKTEVVRERELIRTINSVGWIAYDPDLYHAQEEYLAALHGFKKVGASAIPEIRERAEKLVESARLRLRLLGLNDAQIDQLAKETGPDQRLLLGDVLDSVWLYSTVYEYELQLVNEGDPVDVEVRAFPGDVFTGTVQSIDTVLDPTTRSARVRVIIPNTDNKLKPQMFANARIQVSLGEHLAVPEDAVMDTGRRKIVFVDHGDGRFAPHEVTLAHKAEGYYAVLGGLEVGQRVVTSGNFLMDSESKLRAAASAAAAGAHQH